MKFIEKLNKKVEENNSLLCVGLDPDVNKLPKSVATEAEPILAFNKAIIDATADLVSCYKLNSAFYEPSGPEGIAQMKQTIDYIRKVSPDMPVILDAKRGDIGNTNERYAAYAFEYAEADAVTVHPYQGVVAVAPFFSDPDKAAFVLAKTSNADSSEFQRLKVKGGIPLFMHVVECFLQCYEQTENCFFVAGATFPDELAQIRTRVGDAPLLVPGLGAQGANPSEMIPAGINSKGDGLIINSSRGIIYASDGDDFAEAARKKATETRDKINTYRP